jgi:hypothetical protein
VISIREIETQSIGKDCKDCMKRIRGASDKLSADFARLTELLLAKRKRVGSAPGGLALLPIFALIRPFLFLLHFGPLYFDSKTLEFKIFVSDIQNLARQSPFFITLMPTLNHEPAEL